MASRAQWISRCEALGVSWFDDGEKLSMDAPKGKVFGSIFCHYVDLYYSSWRKSDAYSTLIEDLELGLVDCTDKDCEICNE